MNLLTLFFKSATITYYSAISTVVGQRIALNGNRKWRARGVPVLHSMTGRDTVQSQAFQHMSGIKILSFRNSLPSLDTILRATKEDCIRPNTIGVDVE
jgi:hypothetical protein